MKLESEEKMKINVEAVEKEAYKQKQDVVTSTVDCRKMLRQIVLTGKQQQAFFIADPTKIMENIAKWTDIMPNIKPYFGKLIIRSAYTLVNCLKEYK